jgi:DNA topoisomerase-1
LEQPRRPVPKKRVKQERVKQETGKKSNKKPVMKEMDKAERMSHAMQSFLWWNAEEPPAGAQWHTMEHAGVAFPESYVPHGVKMLYDGKPVTLSPVEEEA